MATLLEKAKAHKQLFRPDQTTKNEGEIEELAIAWFQGDISFSQASAATGSSGSTLYGLLAVALRRAIAGKRIKLKK